MRFASAKLSAHQHGLSVIEALAALALLSLAAMVGAQMIGGAVAAGDRAGRAAEDAASAPLGLAMFQSVLGRSVQSWPEEEASFDGTPDALGGLTDAPLQDALPLLAPFAFAVSTEDDATVLRYRSGGTDWLMGTLAGPGGTFAYLGADGAWHPRWPPDANPAPGPFGEEAFYDTPQLPLAVRLATDDEVWIAAIPAPAPLPARVQDL